MAKVKRSSLTRVEKVRIYPNADQTRLFGHMLWVCCNVYNQSLQERRDAYKRYVLLGKPKDFVWPNFQQQTQDYVAARKENIWLQTVYSETLRDVLKRIDNSMAAFLRRCAAGETPGYPRFKKVQRYDTFTYPHGQRAIKIFQKSLKLPGDIGYVKYKKSGRDLPQTFGCVRISRHAGKWYACFEHVTEPKFCGAIQHDVGVDVGVDHYATLSTGVHIPNGRWERSNHSEFHHQHVSATKKGSKRRRKAVLVLSKSKARERRQRDDFLHKQSRFLVQNFDLIALEDLNILNMVRSAKGTVDEPGTNVAQKAGLNRSILDAAWGKFTTMIAYKAEEAGTHTVFVNPKNTSITCSVCHDINKKNRLSQAEFCCKKCGHAENADVNAAKNILYYARLGLAKDFRSPRERESHRECAQRLETKQDISPSRC